MLSNGDILSAMRFTNRDTALVWFTLGNGDLGRYIENGEIKAENIREDIEFTRRNFNLLWYELLKQAVSEREGNKNISGLSAAGIF